jgi:hypothetical protein
MMATTTIPALERALTRQMLPVLAFLIAASAIPAVHGVAVTLALGWGAAWLYYVILGRGVRKLFERGERAHPHAGQVLVRQGVCLLALSIAFRWYGDLGWLALVSLLVGRHWILVAASTDDAVRAG